MNIGKLSSEIRNGELFITSSITLAGETRTGFYSLPEEYMELAETVRCDSFVLSLVIPAMMLGESIHVDGVMSERLFYQLRDELIPIMNAFNPNYKIVDISADELTSEEYAPGALRGVGTGLSGGIDSFCCIYKHWDKAVSERYKLTHLFFFNVGSHGMGKTKEQLTKLERKFRARFADMKRCADELGLPLIPINSNIHSFFDVGHLECCSFVTPGAALLVQKGIGRYYLASGGHDFRDKYHQLVDLRESNDAAEIDPLLIPYMSTENLLLEPTETRMRRIEKTELMSEYPIAQKYLNVCCNYDAMERNCSFCEKCCCTLAMLDLLGKAEAFKSVFDIDLYRKKAEKHFIGKVIAQQKVEPFFHSIVKTARQKNICLLDKTTKLTICYEHFHDSKLHNALRKLPGLRQTVRFIKRLASKD